MIRVSNINIDDAADYKNYLDLMNDDSIEILMETYHTNKDGDAYCIIKYDEKSKSENGAPKDCAPFRI